MRKSVFAGFIALTLAGCGGGGGTSTPSTPVVTTPAPTISLTLSKPKVSLGSSSTVTWSSTNATSCTASGAWSGTQAISGTSAQTPTASGARTYTLTCTGAGGSSNQSVSLIVPIPVQKSSYLNAKNLNINTQTLPIIPRSEMLQGPTIVNERISEGYAFADFFQDGSLSLAVFTKADDNVFKGYNSVTAGRVFFYQNINGSWVNKTDQLIKDRTGCITSRKVIVADFNGDGVPDIFSACSGIDGNIPPGYKAGEHSRILMSQADGTYKNVEMLECYCHGASAADVNGNGFANIIVVDPVINKGPYFFINNKDGTFTKDSTRLPAASQAFNNGLYARDIYSVELIDFNNVGKFDVILMGAEPTQSNQQAEYPWLTTIYKNDGSNSYLTTTPIVLPKDSTYINVIDIVFEGTNIYLLRTTSTSVGTKIQKIDTNTLSSSDIYVRADAYPSVNGANPQDNAIWMFMFNGNLVSQDSTTPFSVPK